MYAAFKGEIDGLPEWKQYEKCYQKEGDYAKATEKMTAALKELKRIVAFPQ